MEHAMVRELRENREWPASVSKDDHWVIRMRVGRHFVPLPKDAYPILHGMYDVVKRLFADLRREDRPGGAIYKLETGKACADYTNKEDQ